MKTRGIGLVLAISLLSACGSKSGPSVGPGPQPGPKPGPRREALPPSQIEALKVEGIEIVHACVGEWFFDSQAQWEIVGSAYLIYCINQTLGYPIDLKDAGNVQDFLLLQRQLNENGELKSRIDAEQILESLKNNNFRVYELGELK